MAGKEAWKVIADNDFMPRSQFEAALPFATKRNKQLFYHHLCEAMRRYDIDTAERQAAFIAQIAHESGSLRYVEEIASGEAYEGRKDLGNIKPGDGVKYKGRGLIQITGRANYMQVAEELRLPELMANPELLEEPKNASLSAAWYWDSRSLNELADLGDFRRITYMINGGYNGYQDRIKNWDIAKKAFNIFTA